MTQAMEVLLKAGDKISVLTGDEFSAVSLMAMGVKGAVMATANVVPDAWVKMYDLVQAGKIQEAMEMFPWITSPVQGAVQRNYISPLKYAMAQAGVPLWRIQAAPLLEAKDETKAWVDS